VVRGGIPPFVGLLLLVSVDFFAELPAFSALDEPAFDRWQSGARMTVSRLRHVQTRARVGRRDPSVALHAPVGMQSDLPVFLLVSFRQFRFARPKTRGL
jgi:hypothetical protein